MECSKQNRTKIISSQLSLDHGHMFPVFFYVLNFSCQLFEKLSSGGQYLPEEKTPKVKTQHTEWKKSTIEENTRSVQPMNESI